MAERRQSAARTRAEEHKSGFETTLLRLPEGVRFWKPEAGVAEIDIIPYTVTKGNRNGKGVRGGNPHAETNWLYYERTFWSYRDIGPEKKSFVCPSKTFAAKDYISEYQQILSRKPGSDPEEIKALNPKERQLFLIRDHEDDPDNIQLWEFSYHKFGKLLDARVKSSKETSGWDQFYFPDEGGMSLQLTITNDKQFGLDVIAVDFMPRREPLPSQFQNHGIDLDNMLIHIPYEELKAIFLCEDAPEPTKGKQEEDTTQRKEPERETQKEWTKDTKKEEQSTGSSSSSGPITASSLGLKRDQAVTVNKKPYTVTKILPDDTTLVLIDEDDNTLKVQASELDQAKKSSKSTEKKAKTADECGLSPKMRVMYKGKPHLIHKISSDAMLLTLLTDDDDSDVVKDINPSDVVIVNSQIADEIKKETTTAKASSGKKETAGVGVSDDEKWDKDWDDDGK